MKSTTFGLRAGLVLILGLAASTGRGGIISQNLGNAMATISFFEPIGQTFVAVESPVSAIAFAFVDMNPSFSNSAITMTLYRGSGIGGPVIDSATQVLPVTLSGAFIDFDFSGNNLVIGDTYTAAVTTTSPKVGVLFNQFFDLYLPGHGFEANPVHDLSPDLPLYDLRFRVTSVPEPTAASLFVFGIVFLAGAFRRQSKS